MMLKVLFVVVAIVTVAQCKVKYCCYPDEWEAVEGVMIGSVDDEGHTAISNGYINLSYDAKNQRIHGVETIITNGMTKVFTFLQLYNESVQYTIVNKTCTRAKLGSWNNQNCIPDNATVVSQYRIGLNQSISVSDYSYNVGQEAVVVTIENKNCVPVVLQQFGSLNGVELMLAAGVQGLTAGIKDPSVFDIPAACNQAEYDQKNLRTISLTRRK